MNGAPEYQPYIADPEYVTQFEGLRFLVLRASGGVPEVFAHVIAALRQRFPSTALSYLAHPHVTLGGFARGTDLDRVRELSDTWAAQVPRLSIAVEGLAVTPDPFRIVLLKVRRTADLVHALSSLRRLADERGPRVSDEVSVDAWRFHLSVAYCAALTAAEWDEVVQFVPGVAVPSASCTVDDAEIVAFDAGREYLGGVCRLGGETRTR